MKYTSGPWKVSDDNDYVYPAVTDGQKVFRLDWICQFFYKDESDMKNAEANANLIAAAPDLVEACLPFVTIADSIPASFEDDRPLWSLGDSNVITAGDLRRIRAALQKAGVIE